MLLPSERLDRSDDLSLDAELGERAERRLTVGTEIADRLVEPDHPFLNEVVFVGADQEVVASLHAREVLVSKKEVFKRRVVAGPRPQDQFVVPGVRESFVNSERLKFFCHVLPIPPGDVRRT